LSAIAVRGLRKSYGDLEAVRGVDFEIEQGEVFGLLGPNGAGKTTTVEILEGYRRRDAGEVSVLGHDPQSPGPDFRQRIGVVLQESEVWPNITVRETHRMFAGYYERPRDIDEVIELVGLSEKRDARVKTLSGGQKRRLDLGLALVGDPDLVFLDEPTTGFDPSARRQAWQVVDGLRALGKTVFLTTHYMDEAENLADRIAVIANGTIVAEGTPQTLGGREQMHARISFTFPPGVALDGLPLRATAENGRVTVESATPLADVRLLGDWAASRSIDLPDLDVRRPSLEDVYLQLTGGAA
jgi:ABC-2 type transport system ATP-binding protein